MHKTHLAYALIDITAIISVVMCKVDIISLQLEIFTALKDKHILSIVNVNRINGCQI